MKRWSFILAVWVVGLGFLSGTSYLLLVNLLKINALQATEREMTILFEGPIRAATATREKCVMRLITRHNEIPEHAQQVLPYVEVFTDDMVKGKVPPDPYVMFVTEDPNVLWLQLPETNDRGRVLIRMQDVVKMLDEYLDEAEEAPVRRVVPADVTLNDPL